MDALLTKNIILACRRAITAIEIIIENLEKPTKIGQQRALSYLDSSKIALMQIDRLRSFDHYTEKLAEALSKTTIDTADFDYEIHKPNRVISLHGSFDVDKLRNYLLTV